MNKIEYGIDSKITFISELKNGKLLLNLIKLINSKRKNLEEQKVDKNNKRDVFAFIKSIIETRFFIKKGIDYEKASEGDESELAKIAFIILIKASFKEVEAVHKSFKTIDKFYYEIIMVFYEIIKEYKRNPQAIELISIKSIQFCYLSNSALKTKMKKFKKKIVDSSTMSVQNQNPVDEFRQKYEVCKRQLAEIVKLTESDSSLATQSFSFKSECDERIEQLTQDNTLLFKEKSSLEAQIFNLKEEYEKKLNDSDTLVN